MIACLFLVPINNKKTIQHIIFHLIIYQQDITDQKNVYIVIFNCRARHDSESSNEDSDDSGLADESQNGRTNKKSINKGRWSKEEVSSPFLFNSKSDLLVPDFGRYMIAYIICRLCLQLVKVLASHIILKSSTSNLTMSLNNINCTSRNVQTLLSSSNNHHSLQNQFLKLVYHYYSPYYHQPTNSNHTHTRVSVICFFLRDNTGRSLTSLAKLVNFQFGSWRIRYN